MQKRLLSAFFNSYIKIGDIFITMSNERNVNLMWGTFNLLLLYSERMGHESTPFIRAMAQIARDEIEKWLAVMSAPEKYGQIECPATLSNILPRTTRVVYNHENTGDRPPSLASVIVNQDIPMVMQMYTLPAIEKVIFGFSSARDRIVKHGYKGTHNRIIHETLEIFQQASISYSPPPSKL